jgi:hypothetical protein
MSSSFAKAAFRPAPDRRLGHLKAKHQQFAMDPGRTPLRVFLAHPLDEITQPTIDFGPPCPISGFPSPESFETRAMPTKNRLRLNHLGHAEQTRPDPRHPYEQCPIAAAQSKTRRCSPQSNIKLMPEEQVFSLKTTPRFEHVGDKYS